MKIILSRKRLSIVLILCSLWVLFYLLVKSPYIGEEPFLEVNVTCSYLLSTLKGKPSRHMCEVKVEEMRKAYYETIR